MKIGFPERNLETGRAKLRGKWHWGKTRRRAISRLGEWGKNEVRIRKRNSSRIWEGPRNRKKRVKVSQGKGKGTDKKKDSKKEVPGKG